MATHSSTLTWKIPWMEEPGRLQSMWSLGVGHGWVTSLSLSFSVYSCHLFLVSSASVSISVLYWAHFCMKCSLGISNFLEEISSLSHSIVFFYFFALITEQGFISPCYSLELCIQWVYLSFSPLPLASLLFSAICKASSDNHFAFLHFFFLRMVLIPAFCTMSHTSAHSSSGTLSDLSPWINFFLPLYNGKGFDLGHTWMV